MEQLVELETRYKLGEFGLDAKSSILCATFRVAHCPSLFHNHFCLILFDIMSCLTEFFSASSCVPYRRGRSGGWQ